MPQQIFFSNIDNNTKNHLIVDRTMYIAGKVFEKKTSGAEQIVKSKHCIQTRYFQSMQNYIFKAFWHDQYNSVVR